MLFDLAQYSTLIGSNYPCLEQIFIVPKVLEPLKLDCIMYVYESAGGEFEKLLEEHHKFHHMAFFLQMEPKIHFCFNYQRENIYC